MFTTKVAGYPSVFAHGMLTMGMTGRLVTDLVGAENVTSFGGRFTSQVFPGDTLTGKLVVDSVDGGVAQMTVDDDEPGRRRRLRREGDRQGL